MLKYIGLIKIRPTLTFLRNEISWLEAFVKVLPDHSAELSNVKLWLAHKVLHLANMLYDPTARNITAILDWKFAGVVPVTLGSATGVPVEWTKQRALCQGGTAISGPLCSLLRRERSLHPRRCGLYVNATR